VPRPIAIASIILLATLAASLARAASACFTGAAPPPRYEIHDGEVYDTQTHLTWQRCSVGQRWSGERGCVGVIHQMSWQEATQQANARWQLPSKDELASLIDSDCGSPAIDERAFPDMELMKLWYWTGTREGALAWYVAFGGGTMRAGGPLELSSVRLVRRGRQESK
jgi:hypothetical protein